MEKSPLTDTRTTVIAPAIDVTQRLQDVISKWRTLSEGFSLDQLYKDCCDMVGPDKHLLPLKIITVNDLDATTLTNAMKRRGITITFRVAPIGRFESALIPDRAQQNFYLALEEALQPADQVALFGHAVAHLIKNH